MARALVTEPRLLLLDEPLAALDVSVKTDIRRQLRSVLRASSAANLLVTHDLLCYRQPRVAARGRCRRPGIAEPVAWPDQLR